MPAVASAATAYPRLVVGELFMQVPLIGSIFPLVRFQGTERCYSSAFQPHLLTKRPGSMGGPPRQNIGSTSKSTAFTSRIIACNIVLLLGCLHNVWVTPQQRRAVIRALCHSAMREFAAVDVSECLLKQRCSE